MPGQTNLGTLALTEGADAGYGRGGKVSVKPLQRERWPGLSSSGPAGLCIAGFDQQGALWLKRHPTI